MNIEIITLFAIALGFVGALSSYIILDKNGKRITKNSEKMLSDFSNYSLQNDKSINSIIANYGRDISQEKMRKVIDFKIDRSKKFDSTVELLIQNHHEQAIFQSKVQFWFSLCAAVVGFVFIIVMIAATTSSKWYEYLLKVLPGVIIETVSYLFFSQSKETRAQASDFLNRLREDRQFEKGTALAETISNEELKASVIAQIAMHLCGISSDENGSENKENQLIPSSVSSRVDRNV